MIWTIVPFWKGPPWLCALGKTRPHNASRPLTLTTAIFSTRNPRRGCCKLPAGSWEALAAVLGSVVGVQHLDGGCRGFCRGPAPATCSVGRWGLWARYLGLTEQETPLTNRNRQNTRYKYYSWSQRYK